MNSALNLHYDSAKESLNKLVLCIIKDAIKLGVDSILLEVDLELHLKVQKASEVIHEKYKHPSFFEAIFKSRFKDYFSFGRTTIEKMFFELGQLPQVLRIIYSINGVQEAMPSACGNMFVDIVRILQSSGGIAPNTNREVSATIETVKPVSQWNLESKDLTQKIELKRIRGVQ